MDATTKVFKELERFGSDNTQCLKCDRRKTKSLKKVIVFSAFSSSARSATAPACMEEWGRYEGARVSEQVASKTKHMIHFRQKPSEMAFGGSIY